MGENESRQELRELATLEAKRRILEQVGVYIESTTELKQTIAENNTMLLDESEFSKEIIAITAGVTNTTIDKEEWKDENGVFVLYLTCKIKVDTEDVNMKIQALVKDREKLADVKMLQDVVGHLELEIVELRHSLQQANTSNIEDIRKHRLRLSNEFSAAEWLEKCFNSNDYDEQIKYCTFAIEINPGWSKPYAYRGLSFYGLQDPSAAIVDFNEALRIDPNNAIAHLFRGLSYIDQGKYDKAIEDFNILVQINPDHANAYCHRGIAYAFMGNFQFAIKDFSKTIQIEPSHKLAYDKRGLVYLHQNDYSRAIVDLNHAILIHPNVADAYTTRGYAYSHIGQWHKAIADYNRSINIDRFYSLAYFNRGVAYWYGLQDRINALNSFQKAKELGSTEAQLELDKLR